MLNGKESESYLPQGIEPNEIPLKELLYYVGHIGRQNLEIPGYLASKAFTIKINGVPDGPLIPEEVRREWVGITLAEARVLLEDLETTYGEKIEKGKYYGVPMTNALPALLEHSISAARWFASRSPVPAWLFFNKDVAEVVEK